MSFFSQVIVSGNRVRPLLRALDAAGVAWAACPYSDAGAGCWRVLAADVMGEPGEFGVSGHTVEAADAAIQQVEGNRCSSGWAGRRQRWQAMDKRRSG